MSGIRTVCVYCGSREGARADYVEAARATARAIAARGCDFVYGGGGVGLMRIVADEALAAGRSVTGVIPRALFRAEVAHPGVTELVDVDTMHERKQEMHDRSDAFLALPGGFGTLEEIFEALTWTQLGIHKKPIGFLDVAGYYAGLRAFVEHQVAEGFVSQRNLDSIVFDPDPERLLARMWEARPEGLALDWTRGAGD